MVWAIDQKDQTQSSGFGSAPDVTPNQQSNAQQMSSDHAASLSCYTTDCNANCKSRTNKVSEVFGQPGQVSTRYEMRGCGSIFLMLVTRDRCSKKSTEDCAVTTAQQWANANGVDTVVLACRVSRGVLMVRSRKILFGRNEDLHWLR